MEIAQSQAACRDGRALLELGWSAALRSRCGRCALTGAESPPSSPWQHSASDCGTSPPSSFGNAVPAIAPHLPNLEARCQRSAQPHLLRCSKPPCGLPSCAAQNRCSKPPCGRPIVPPACTRRSDHGDGHAAQDMQLKTCNAATRHAAQDMQLALRATGGGSHLWRREDWPLAPSRPNPPPLCDDARFAGPRLEHERSLGQPASTQPPQLHCDWQPAALVGVHLWCRPTTFLSPPPS